MPSDHELSTFRSRGYDPAGKQDERPLEVEFYQPQQPVSRRGSHRDGVLVPERVYVPSGNDRGNPYRERPDLTESKRKAHQVSDRVIPEGGGGGSSHGSEILEFDPLDDVRTGEIEHWIDEHERFRVGNRHEHQVRYPPHSPPPSSRFFVDAANHNFLNGNRIAAEQYHRHEGEMQMRYERQSPVERSRSLRRDRGRRERSQSVSGDSESLLTKIHNCGGYC